MITALAMSLAGFFHDPSAYHRQVATRAYRLRPWTVLVGHDRFTDAVTCSLFTPTVRYLPGALIFHLRDGAETTHAVFRVDDGPPTRVAVAFHQLESAGYFPRRGWIDRPAGGDVALPSSWLDGASRIWIRATPRQPPSAFDISSFADALDRAQDLGCPDRGFVDIKG